jgi:hypothetical protein
VTPEECAHAVAGPIGRFGGDWMMAPSSFVPAIEAGFAGLDFYYRGRGGVLGEVDADVVVAAMGLLGPDLATSSWNDGRAVMEPDQAARMFAEACADFGRANFVAEVDYRELAELSGTVIRAADCAGLPLFAGWRAMPVPEDPKGGAAHQLNVLRELRGGAHVVAVIAHGLSPLQATLASTGPGVARFLGYSEPFPEVTDSVRATREEVEVTTNAIVAPAFAALDESVRLHFVEAVRSALDF